jgi:hypothetical protein
MSPAVLINGFCIALLLATTCLHYEALQALNLVVPRLRAAGRARVLVVMVSLFVVHVTEVIVFAAAYYLLSRHNGLGALGTAGPPSFNVSLYFSFETYSSLGYGDVVPAGALRMLAGAEALNGLLLIGWSASYTHFAMERFWQEGKPRSPGRRRTRYATGQAPSAGAFKRKRTSGRRGIKPG